MKEIVWMIFAEVSIALFLYSMAILGTALEDITDTPVGWEQPIPSERCRWTNPAGYGLPAETEEYSGLVW